jgi:hypothetical protein
VTVGYSGTPLARKLGIKENQVLALLGAPTGWSVPELPAGVVVRKSLRGSPPDVAIAFCPSAAALRAGITGWGEAVFPAGSLWIAWPRRAGGHTSDVGDHLVREVVLPLGLVDVKVAAIDEDWSGLKMMWRKELRTGDCPIP